MSEFRTNSHSAKLAEAYLAHYADGHPAEGDWSATEEIDELVRRDPIAAWPVILQLIRLAPDDAALAYVGAGPVEDLLIRHGPAVVHLFEQQGLHDARFRQCVWCIYTQRVDKDVVARLVAMLRTADPERFKRSRRAASVAKERGKGIRPRGRSK